jgi:hypothetical protein
MIIFQLVINKQTCARDEEGRRRVAVVAEKKKEFNE